MAASARLSHLLTHRNVAMGGGRNVAVFNGMRTFVEIWNSEAAFEAIRLIYASVRGGEGYGIGGAVVRTVSSASHLSTGASGEAGAARFVSVRFDDLYAGSVKSTLDQIGFPPLPGVAAGVDVWTPTLILSDFVEAASVERQDRGPGHLLEVRTLIQLGQALTGPYTSHKSGIDASDPQILTGRSGQKLFGFADLVSDAHEIGAGDLDLGTRGQGAVYAVQFRCLQPGATIQAVGDSIVQGGGFQAAPYISGHHSFAHIACASLSSPELPVALLQSGVGGEPSLNFYESALVDFRHSDVSIALIQTWSGNDISHAVAADACVTAADAAWGRAMHYGGLVRQNGGIPIFLSAVPQAPKMGSAAAEAARRSSVDRCTVLASNGELALDLNTLLGDTAPITNYKPGLGCDDNIHPNTAGNEAISEALLPLLRSALGIAASAGAG